MQERIIVLTNHFNELSDQYKMFMDMLHSEIEESHIFNRGGRIITPRYNIRFYCASAIGDSLRGLRADRVINLVRNEEFHNMVALPMLNGSRARREL